MADNETPSTPEDSRGPLQVTSERLRAVIGGGGDSLPSLDPTCSTCMDAQFVAGPKVDAQPRRPIPCPDCYREPTFEERLAAAGVPKQFEEASLAVADDSLALRALSRLAGDLELAAGLTLAGPPGTGKTWLACAFLNDWIKRDQVGWFTTVAALLDGVRQRFGDTLSDDALEYFALWLRPPVLVLDDLGAEKVSDWTIERITRLLNERMTRGYITIVTTNLATPEALNEALGFRIADRIQGLAWVDVGGDSRREAEGVASTRELTGEAPPWWHA